MMYIRSQQDSEALYIFNIYMYKITLYSFWSQCKNEVETTFSRS
jgi:hypothetical protein